MSCQPSPLLNFPKTVKQFQEKKGFDKIAVKKTKTNGTFLINVQASSKSQRVTLTSMVKSMVHMARVEKNKWLNQWCLWQWWKKTKG